jgi:hypothetical protein
MFAVLKLVVVGLTIVANERIVQSLLDRPADARVRRVVGKVRPEANAAHDLVSISAGSEFGDTDKILSAVAVKFLSQSGLHITSPGKSSPIFMWFDPAYCTGSMNIYAKRVPRNRQPFSAIRHGVRTAPATPPANLSARGVKILATAAANAKE